MILGDNMTQISKSSTASTTLFARITRTAASKRRSQTLPSQVPVTAPAPVILDDRERLQQAFAQVLANRSQFADIVLVLRRLLALAHECEFQGLYEEIWDAHRAEVDARDFASSSTSEVAA